MNGQYEFAGRGSRFLAGIIDGIIVWLIGFIIGFISGFISVFLSESLNNFINAITLIGSFLIGVLYYVYYQQINGQTLGKKAMGIRVIKTDGTKPTKMDFVIREVFGKPISVILLGIGYLMILWDQNRQGLHDKLAKTYVVKVIVTQPSPQPIQTMPPQQTSVQS